MQGNQLWHIFINSNVENDHLIALAEDAGKKSEYARGETQKALLAIAMRAAQEAGGVVVFSPSQLYQALKTWMPGGNNPFNVKEIRTRLLEAIAYHYKRKDFFVSTIPSVREYFEQVAAMLPELEVSSPPPSSPSASASTTMGSDSLTGTPAKPSGINKVQYRWLVDTVQHLAQNPSKVSDNRLAGARNFAARAGLKSTLAGLEAEIEKRGTGAQVSPSRSPSSPVWRLALAGAFIGCAIIFMGSR